MPLAATAEEFERLISSYDAQLRSATTFEQFVAALITRDQIAATLKSDPLLAEHSIRKLSELDAYLRVDKFPNLPADVTHSLPDYRDSLGLSPVAWWWNLGEDRGGGAIWTILAGLCLTVSLALSVDFIRRMLGTDPDAWGIAAITLQATLTFAAGGSMSSLGRQWVEAALTSRGIAKRRVSATIAAFCFVVGAASVLVWSFAPSYLAEQYNNAGFTTACQNEPRPCPTLPKALVYLRRAVALQPRFASAHYNLGRVYERANLIDKAIEQYQATILVFPRHENARNNWARLLLLKQNDNVNALRILDEALYQVQEDRAAPSANVTKLNRSEATLRKNRAWALLATKHTTEAEADLSASLRLLDTAAAHCLLGQAFDQEQRRKEAYDEFRKCIVQSQTEPPDSPKVEPDWIRTAKEYRIQ